MILFTSLELCPLTFGPAFTSEKSGFPSEQNLKQKLLNLQQLYLIGLSGIGIVLEWRSYSRELGLKALQNATPHANTKYRSSHTLVIYHRLKGSGKTKLFFEVSNRSIRYLEECLGHDNLTEIEISDAGRFRDHFFARGMSSSSVKRVFNSVRSIINLNIREYGLDGTNAFSGTYVPDGFDTPKRKPIPNDPHQSKKFD